MSHGVLLVVSSIIELLIDFVQLEEHCFGLLVHRRSEEGGFLNDVVDNSLENFSGFN